MNDHVFQIKTSSNSPEDIITEFHQAMREHKQKLRLFSKNEVVAQRKMNALDRFKLSLKRFLLIKKRRKNNI